MFYYFDEAGDFSVPKSRAHHKVAVVVGVAVSDAIYDDLNAGFRQFANNLPSSACANGEPKGRLLSYEHKRVFCEFLSEYDGVSITPVTLDLSSLSGSRIDRMPERMSCVLTEWADKMLYNEASEQLVLLARQYANLSVNQSLRIYSLAACIREALEHSILFLSSEQHESAWNSLRFELDRVQVRPNSREEKVFSLVVLGWLMGWSRTRSLLTVKELHTDDHPFVKNYVTHDGADLGKIFYNNLYWVNSRDSWGVQLADISATIVYQAASALNDEDGLVSLYRLLMRKSAYGSRRGPGLTSPLRGLSPAIARKYSILSKAMEKRRT